METKRMFGREGLTMNDFDHLPDNVTKAGAKRKDEEYGTPISVGCKWLVTMYGTEGFYAHVLFGK